MNLDSIDIIFRSILLINIFYLVRMLITEYLKPVLVSAAETETKKIQMLHEKKELLRKNISHKEFEFIETTKTLAVLEKKITNWQAEVEKRLLKQQHMQTLFLARCSDAAAKQQVLHMQNKEKKELLQTCSHLALDEIQKNNPELFDAYTKKQIKLFAADEGELS
jgi:hypothetical protein